MSSSVAVDGSCRTSKGFRLINTYCGCKIRAVNQCTRNPPVTSHTTAAAFEMERHAWRGTKQARIHVQHDVCASVCCRIERVGDIHLNRETYEHSAAWTYQFAPLTCRPATRPFYWQQFWACERPQSRPLLSGVSSHAPIQHHIERPTPVDLHRIHTRRQEQTHTVALVSTSTHIDTH